MKDPIFKAFLKGYLFAFIISLAIGLIVFYLTDGSVRI